MAKIDENMSSLKNGLKALYGSKLGKIIPVLVIAGLVATASASVFVIYYGSATASVGSNDLALYAGTDSTACTTNFPCINVSPSTTNDFVTISLNLGKSAVDSPQPLSYFTNATVIKNTAASASHTITSITVQAGTDSNAADLGQINVYYCSTQTNTPATSCTNSWTINSSNLSTGGAVFSGSDSLAAGTTRYIEFTGFTGATATNGDTINFNLQIQWA